jgi:hypothetical protein
MNSDVILKRSLNTNQTDKEIWERPLRQWEGFWSAVSVTCVSRLHTGKEIDAMMISELVRIWKDMVMD